MADYESRDLATAARRAQEEMAGDDDRPSIAEIADYVRRETLEHEVGEARRQAIAEVVEALREASGRDGGPVDAYYRAADFIEQRFAWTPTDHGYDEEAGW